MKPTFLCVFLLAIVTFVYAVSARTQPTTVRSVPPTIAKSGPTTSTHCARQLQRIESIIVSNVLEKSGADRVKVAVDVFFSEAARVAERDAGIAGTARRGEHVINDGVLKVYNKIMERFLLPLGLTLRELNALALLPAESQLLRDMGNLFGEDSERVRENITAMTVDSSDTYPDVNAEMFGLTICMLEEICVRHMKLLSRIDPITPSRETRLTEALHAVTKKMNTDEVYVDRRALNLWKQQLGRGRGAGGKPGQMQRAHGQVLAQERYDRTKQAVVTMFQQLHDRTRDWVVELRRIGKV